MAWLWWLAAAFALGLVEIFVLDVVVLMLMGGTLAAAAAAALGAPVWAQFAVFAVASVLLVLLLRPWVMRKLNRSVPLEPTGVDAHLGKRAVVVSPVSGAGGRVKLAGEVWTARLPDAFGEPLPVGSEVEVQRIAGATAVVVPIVRTVEIPGS